MVIKALKKQMNLLIPMKKQLSMLVTMSIPILMPIAMLVLISLEAMLSEIESNADDVYESLANLFNFSFYLIKNDARLETPIISLVGTFFVQQTLSL